MPVPSAILTTLSPEDLAGLEAFARERVRSIDDCHEWLQAHGYAGISRSSVGRWKKSFHMNDRFAAASDLARELMEAKKNAGGAGGSVDIADGANLKLHQLLFDKLLEIETRAVVDGGEGEGEGIDTGELLDLANALRSGAATKQQVEELKKTQREAVAAAERDAKAGASGEQVVSKVKELLGL